MSHLESGSVVWVRLGQAWWPGTITTVAKCPPEFVQAIRKTPIAIVKFFHENEYQDVHKEEHIFPYNCDRKEEFIRKGQAVNKNQSHGDVDLLAKFEADVVTAEKLTGGDMDILRSLVEGADTYKAFHHAHCPPTSPGLDSNNTVISGQPSQPPLAFPCPAGVDFESRPQENLWPERVEAHTRLDCNTSKVRNPQNCQAASFDHQIALLSRDLPSPVAHIAARVLEQAQPNLGGTSLIPKHCSSNTGEEEKPAAQQKASSSHVNSSFMEELANNEVLGPTCRVRDGEVLEDEDEEEEEEEEEEDSLNHELHYESERFAESVDEDSLILDFEMEGEEDEPEPQQPASEGEGEVMESESESDPLYEVEDEEDGSIAMLGAEQDGLTGPADEDEDSLIPDIEMESEEEDGELTERIAQTHLPQSWETDEDDSEEEMYQNLPSASATDEEEVGWMNNSAEKENKGADQLHNPNFTKLQGIVEDKRNSSKETEEEGPSSEKGAICQEGEESSSSERARSFSKSKPPEEAAKPSQETFLEPLTQETNHKHHHKGDQGKEEEETHKDKDKDKHNSHTPSNPELTCSTKTNHYQDKGPSEDNISNQDSKDPTTLTLPVLESPSTSKLSDNSLNFEGFDREKTRQASARLLMLLKVRYLQPKHKSQNWKPKTAPRRRGRPSLRGRIGSMRGKRSGKAQVRRKRSQRAVSTTTSTTSDTDEGQEEELESARQGSIGGRGGRSGSGWIKRRRARGRPNKRKIKHSTLGKKTLHRKRKNTENIMEKRKTRSSDKEREDEGTKTTRKSRDPYERFAHSPDITSFSEAKPRQSNWGGTRGVEDRAGQYVPPGDPPVKRARKRKPSEVDNLLQWAVETGHTGTRNRSPRERHHSVTSSSTASNNNNTNNNNNNLATRRSRLETKMANKEQKKRGRKKKARTDTEEEREEDEELGKQDHTHSSSDDPLINSEEELSDISKGRGRLVYPHKNGDLVWVQLESRWWPAYVDQVYPQTRRVSVYRVGVKQEASTKVDLSKVRSFQFGEVPAFVDRSESGFTEAFQVTESFCLLRNHGNKVSAHKFFTMPPEEQDALIIKSFTPKDDPALSTPQGKRTRGSASEEPQSKSQKGWFYEPLNSDSEDGMGTRGEDRYEMSARDRRKMQKSLRSRRRENEKLIKFMNSAACMDHLWQIFSGQKQCERHRLYQSEATRRSLLWSGIGPFQLDQDDDQILSVVDFLHTEMNKKQPDFNLAQDYVFKVWMPEAIKEALRVVLKVPEDMLELALDEGYRESLTDRNTRRLDFL